MDRYEREERSRMSRRRDQYDRRMDWDRDEDESRYGRTRGASRGDLYGRDDYGESMYRNQNEGPGNDRYRGGDEQRWREQPRGVWQRDMRRDVYGGPEYGDDFGRTSDMSGYSRRSGHGQEQRFSMPQDWQRDRWEQGGGGHGRREEPWRDRDDDRFGYGMGGYTGMGRMGGYSGMGGMGGYDEGGESRRGTGGERGSSSRWQTSNRDEQDDRGFRGRGPRDYQRSDERIREDVCDLLTDNPRIDASDITVRVENGEVTLEGSVDSRRIKHMAENLVDECCSGVKDVHNNLRVNRDRSRQGEEEEERGNGRRYFQQSQYGNA